MERGSQESPGEIKSRKVELDSQESPGEIKSREVELDSHSWMDCLAAGLFRNSSSRTLRLYSAHLWK